MSYQANQFGTQPSGPPQASNSGSGSTKTVLVVLAVVVGLGGIGMVVCCGGVFWVMSMGMGMVSADLELQLRDHPLVREHLGEIQSFDVDMIKSGAHDDPDTFVYDVVGTTGEAEMTIRSISQDDGSEEIVSAEMRLSNGETIYLQLDN